MNETVGRTYYNSSYRHGVDEKRRIQIPAKWRSAEAGVELTVVLWPKHKDGPWLRVLPPEKMASMVRDIEALPNSDPNKGILKRLIGSKSVQVSLDSAGRICLPEEMAKAAGIGKEVILVGVLDAYEIWNPERYAKVSESDEIMASEAFKFME
jgi:MraZ protein